MATRTTTMTRKDQITIPVAIRDALDIHEDDVLVVEQVDNQVVLQRAADVVDRTAGIFADYARKHREPLPSRDEIWTEIARERYENVVTDE